MLISTAPDYREGGPSGREVMPHRQRRSWLSSMLVPALGRALRLVAAVIAHRRGGDTESPSAHDGVSVPSMLPADPATPVGATPAAPRPSAASQDASATEPLRVLVVEDDKVNQLVVIGMLRQMAHQADCVADGVEALAALDKRSYDIVLMDLRMPNMDGIEATQRIRRLADPVASIPIVALTANATTEERLRCAEAGMNDFISKPFRRADLKATLEKWRPPGHGGSAGGPPPRNGPAAPR